MKEEIRLIKNHLYYLEEKGYTSKDSESFIFVAKKCTGTFKIILVLATTDKELPPDSDYFEKDHTWFPDSRTVSIKEISKKDLPLYVGWPMVSPELTRMLEGECTLSEE
jgi:hypothetical protein